MCLIAYPCFDQKCRRRVAASAGGGVLAHRRDPAAQAHAAGGGSGRGRQAGQGRAVPAQLVVDGWHIAGAAGQQRRWQLSYTPRSAGMLSPAYSHCTNLACARARARACPSGPAATAAPGSPKPLPRCRTSRARAWPTSTRPSSRGCPSSCAASTPRSRTSASRSCRWRARCSPLAPGWAATETATPTSRRRPRGARARGRAGGEPFHFWALYGEVETRAGVWRPVLGPPGLLAWGDCLCGQEGLVGL